MITCSCSNPPLLYSHSSRFFSFSSFLTSCVFGCLENPLKLGENLYSWHTLFCCVLGSFICFITEVLRILLWSLIFVFFFVIFAEGRWWSTSFDIGFYHLPSPRWWSALWYRFHSHFGVWHQIHSTGCSIQGRSSEFLESNFFLSVLWFMHLLLFSLISNAFGFLIGISLWSYREFEWGIGIKTREREGSFFACGWVPAQTQF